MFDSLVISPQRTRTEYVTREVHEHRAPTDKSVELLKEFEAAAAAKIEQSVSVSDNSFSCVVHKMRDFASDRNVLKAIFTLNGKKHSVEFSEHSFERQDALFKGFRAAIANAIVDEVLTNAKLHGF